MAFASSLDQIGPMGRTVRDVAALYSVICGQDNRDATSEYRSYPNFADNLDSNLKGLKVALPKEYFGEGIDPAVKQSVRCV